MRRDYRLSLAHLRRCFRGQYKAMTTDEVAAAQRVSRHTARTRLKDLADEGFVRRVANNLWARPDADDEVIACRLHKTTYQIFRLMHQPNTCYAPWHVAALVGISEDNARQRLRYLERLGLVAPTSGGYVRLDIHGGRPPGRSLRKADHLSADDDRSSALSDLLS